VASTRRKSKKSSTSTLVSSLQDDFIPLASSDNMPATILFRDKNEKGEVSYKAVSPQEIGISAWTDVPLISKTLAEKLDISTGAFTQELKRLGIPLKPTNVSINKMGDEELGLALYSHARPFKKGEIICAYWGVIRANQEFRDKYGNKEKKTTYSMSHAVDMAALTSDTLITDGENFRSYGSLAQYCPPLEELGYYQGHHLTANAIVTPLSLLDGKISICVLKAGRDIPPYSLIGIDYSLDYWKKTEPYYFCKDTSFVRRKMLLITPIIVKKVKESIKVLFSNKNLSDTKTERDHLSGLLVNLQIYHYHLLSMLTNDERKMLKDNWLRLISIMKEIFSHEDMAKQLHATLSRFSAFYQIKNTLTESPSFVNRYQFFIPSSNPNDYANILVDENSEQYYIAEKNAAFRYSLQKDYVSSIPRWLNALEVISAKTYIALQERGAIAFEDAFIPASIEAAKLFGYLGKDYLQLSKLYLKSKNIPSALDILDDAVIYFLKRSEELRIVIKSEQIPNLSNELMESQALLTQLQEQVAAPKTADNEKSNNLSDALRRLTMQ
jgi:hypothetical protein